MAFRYPQDSRNTLAAQLLHSLARDNTAIPEHLVAEINASHGLANAAREIARKVGFSVFPEDFAEFVHATLLHVAKERKEISRVFSKPEAAR